MFKSIFLFVFYIIFSCPFACAENKNYIIKPEIIKILDGDTIQIKTKETPVSVRLTGIDCPETRMNPHIYCQKNEENTFDGIINNGKIAKRELENIINSKKSKIYLEITGIDKKYGRLAGIFYYKENRKYININEELINKGVCSTYIFRTNN